MAQESSKKMQDDLRNSAHQVWLAGLGALASAGEEGEKLFKRLVERGETLETEGQEKVNQAQTVISSAWSDLESGLDQRITSVLQQVGVPSRDEIQQLTRRVEELNSKIEALNSKRSA